MTYGYPMPGGTVTGEAVLLELRPARLASRTVAFVIDLIVQGVFGFGLLLAYVLIGLHMDSDLEATFSLILFLVIWLGYPILLETLWRGRTLGKAALGLRVVREDGGPAPFTSIVVRELVGVILEKPGITMGVVAIATTMSSERAKRLGDMLAGTMVVSERVPGRESAPVVMPPPLAAWAATLDLSRVPDSFGLAIRQFLGRAAQLDPAARDRLGAQLAAQAFALTSPPPPQGTPGWAYLSAISAERRRRDELGHRPPATAPSYGSIAPQPVPRPAAPVPPPPAGPGGFSAPV